MHNRPFLLSAKSYSKIFRPHMPPKIASRRESRGQIFPARKQNCLPRHPEPCEGSLWKYRQNFNRDPSASLRFAQDDKKVAKPPFINPTARGKMTLLPKRPQFAAYLRLNSERVNAARSYNREHLRRAPQRENQMQSRAVPRRTFGCLSDHGNFFHLF